MSRQNFKNFSKTLKNALLKREPRELQARKSLREPRETKVKAPKPAGPTQPEPLDDEFFDFETHSLRCQFDFREMPSIFPQHVPDADAIPVVCLPLEDWQTFQGLAPEDQRAHLTMCRIVSCMAWLEGPRDLCLRLPNDDIGIIDILSESDVPSDLYVPLNVKPTTQDYEHFLDRATFHRRDFHITVPI